jgi:hypothetical protein
MKKNISKNQTKRLVTNIVDIFRPIGEMGLKYIPVILYGHLESLCAQEFRRILTHNLKGLPIVFLYSLLDGCNT